MANDLYPWLQTHQHSLLQRWNQQRMPHALLMLGPLGLGQTQLVDWLVRLILVGPEQKGLPPSPAGQWISDGTHPDLLWVSVAEDKTSISIQQIRAVTEFLQQSSHQGGHKIVVIEQADWMQVAARDALLKSLEEPSAHRLIVLLAQSEGRLSRTLVSRCQRVHIASPAVATVWPWLKGVSGQTHLTQDDAQQALLRAGGAPLLAVEWLNPEVQEAWHQWSEDLEAVRLGKKDPLVVAESWAPSEKTGTWLPLWVEQQIRLRLSRGESVPVFWFDWQAEMERFAWKWTRSTLNKLLLLQTTLIELSEKGRQTR
jgi:DNA polymerase-3 subunit delta'